MTAAKTLIMILVLGLNGAAFASELVPNLPLFKKPLSGKRVAVVDDSNVNLIVAKKMLQSLGAEVFVAHNSDEAVALVGAVDVFLMDNQMLEDGNIVDDSGLKAATRIRKNSDTPVLMHSSNHIDIDILTEHGATGEILKGQSPRDVYVEAILAASPPN